MRVVRVLYLKSLPYLSLESGLNVAFPVYCVRANAQFIEALLPFNKLKELEAFNRGGSAVDRCEDTRCVQEE